jgi:hypothetical protein
VDLDRKLKELTREDCESYYEFGQIVKHLQDKILENHNAFSVGLLGESKMSGGLEIVRLPSLKED